MFDDGLRFASEGARVGSWNLVEGVRAGVGFVGMGRVEGILLCFSSVMGDMGFDGSVVGRASLLVSSFEDRENRILN